MPTIKRQYEKLKRNSICPCDNNMTSEKPKKYKQCCLPKMVAQEQKTRMMINDRKEIAEIKRHVANSIQHDIDHPLLLPDNDLCVPGNSSGNIIVL